MLTSKLPRITIFSIGLLVLGSMVTGCSEKNMNNRGEKKNMSAKTIEEVLKEHTDEWMSIPGVVGMGIGELKEKPCIKVFVVKKTEELNEKIPSQVDGYPVIIEETGEIRALKIN